MFWYFKHKTFKTDVWNLFEKKWKDTLNVKLKPPVVTASHC